MNVADVLDLWRSEGTPSMARRSLHALHMIKRRRRFRPTTKPSIRPERITLLATEPDPKLGGVTAQCVWRWDLESERWPSGLLYPSERSSVWRLDLAHGTEREVLLLTPLEQRRDGLYDPVPALQELARVGIGGGHILVDGLAGFDPRALARAANNNPIVVFLHDFSTYCARPHLFEEPHRRFCAFSSDAARCANCLAHTAVPRFDLAEHRAACSALLDTVPLAIFSSPFLRKSTLEALELDLDVRRHGIVPPGILRRSLPPRPLQHDGKVRVGFLGGGHAHKGAEVLLRLLDSAEWPLDQWEWHVFGGYGGLLRLLRRASGVRVHGFVPPGSLAERLRSLAIDVTLHLSLVPESFSLTLSESAHAGCHSIASRLGAPADRLPAESLFPPGDLPTLVTMLTNRTPLGSAEPVFADESAALLAPLIDQSSRSRT